MSPNPIDMESIQSSTANGITTYWQDFPPAHYTLKVDSFSLFLNGNIDHYETSMFESGGYKWKLSLYPNGNKKRNVTDHISLYLAIMDIDTLPTGWLVNVSFKFFLYDQIRDKYLTFQYAEEFTTRLYLMKTVIGFDELISLATLNESSNGFLLEDCCIFGAEVFVKKFECHGECISMIKDPLNNTFTWKIPNFSQVVAAIIYSDEFLLGDHKWKICLFPKENGVGKGEHISLYLMLADNIPVDRKFFAEFMLLVKGNHISNDIQDQTEHWFCHSKRSWGFPKFLPLNDLYNQSNSYLVDGTLTVETKITLMSKHKDF